jgi:hypothetical protein
MNGVMAFVLIMCVVALLKQAVAAPVVVVTTRALTEHVVPMNRSVGISVLIRQAHAVTKELIILMFVLKVMYAVVISDMDAVG